MHRQRLRNVPHLPITRVALFPRTPLSTALLSLPSSSISDQTSQSPNFTSEDYPAIFKRPVLLGVPPELCRTSSHTDFERAELQQVGALSITANENEQAH